jgi:signal transduction histidine kinase
MRRVMINVLDNAIQAVKAKEKAETDATTVSYRADVSVTARMDGGHLVMEVVDNGIGMPPDILKRAFEPLFTTRARGTGIGLANVKKIVTEHGGTVTLNSVPGQGTQVTIILPGHFGEE